MQTSWTFTFCMFSAGSLQNLRAKLEQHLDLSLSSAWPLAPTASLPTICHNVANIYNILYEWAKPQTTGNSVKFYQPWILIVYSRIMLGDMRSCIVLGLFFFSHLHHFFLPEELSKPKNSRNTGDSIMTFFIFFYFLMIIVVSSHVGATEGASHLIETVMKYFHSPPPLHVNLLKCFTEIMTCLTFCAFWVLHFICAIGVMIISASLCQVWECTCIHVILSR